MKRVTLLIAAGLLGTAAGDFAGEAKEAPGKAVFAENCVLCHGEKGTPPPMAKSLGVADLASAEWQASRTDEQIRKVISEGSEKPNTLMRAFKNELSEEEIADLVKYVRTLGKTAAKKK
jgi:mono/diheme cytochrome c family protein